EEWTAGKISWQYITGKAVQLTLGRCQLEWEQANRGISFVLAWARLIEDDGSGCVYVHNNKQGFQDCEPYALLEDWLADHLHEYWDTKFTQLRRLRCRFRVGAMQQMFCFMEPFNGRCGIPEQKVGDGVTTISAKRDRCESNQAPVKNTEETPKAAGNSGDASSQTKADDENSPPEEGEMKTPLKRFRRGRAKKKR
ncbi:hypothetical protein AKJ16_DCAP13273, partial [Drosera capensis]